MFWHIMWRLSPSSASLSFSLLVCLCLSVCVSLFLFLSLFPNHALSPTPTMWPPKKHQTHDSRNCKKFGRQSWLIASVIITEFLIVLKFDWETVTKPIPRPVACVWLVGLVCLVTWTTFKFYILRDVKNDVPPINGWAVMALWLPSPNCCQNHPFIPFWSNTHKSFKRTLFIRTKHSMQVLIPPFSSYRTTLKWWKMRCRTTMLMLFWTVPTPPSPTKKKKERKKERNGLSVIVCSSQWPPQYVSVGILWNALELWSFKLCRVVMCI